MAKTTSIQLGDHFDKFIAEKLKSGRYRNASELIREGLRRIETDEQKLEALRARLDIGRLQAEKGQFVENFSFESIMAGIDQRIKSS
jgi:antitoxin ParD1/3/4